MICDVSSQYSLLEAIIDEPRDTPGQNRIDEPEIGIISALGCKQIELAIESEGIHHGEPEGENKGANYHLRKVYSALNVVLGQLSFD